MTKEDVIKDFYFHGLIEGKDYQVGEEVYIGEYHSMLQTFFIEDGFRVGVRIPAILADDVREAFRLNGWGTRFAEAIAEFLADPNCRFCGGSGWGLLEGDGWNSPRQRPACHCVQEYVEFE